MQAKASSDKATVAVVLCTCGGTLLTEKDLAALSGALTAKAGTGLRVLTAANLCSDNERKTLAGQLRKERLKKLVFAGCPSSEREEVHRALAHQAGLAPSNLLPVNLRALRQRKGQARLKELARQILRAEDALALMPAFQTRKISVEPHALVIGAGPAGAHTAMELRNLGLTVTVVEREDTLGPYAEELLGGGGATLPRNPQVLTGSRIVALDGHVGRFEARISTPRGPRSVTVGAVVVAAGLQTPDRAAWPYAVPGTVPLQELAAAVAALPRRRGIRSIAMLLDAAYDENKAAMKQALELALELHDPTHRQLHLMCHDARVASMMLETLYDQVREAGVDIVKYDGSPALVSAGGPGNGGASAGQPEGGVIVSYRDSGLAQEAALMCDLVGVSDPGIQPAADPALAALLGLTTDSYGQLQENNIHLFPELTNRQGIFVVGSCRGQHHLPELVSEARTAALAVHSLLAPGVMEIELSSPVVDADKCILCLTCVRACPYGAMQVDHAKGAAASVPEACRRCGICAGECPAKAIQLPAYSDAVLHSQIGAG
ncbi:MAG: 4Fe-4S binding protein [Spirochaetales bacterium]|nr:4Fe-4S binding protein [Spirochaetales bacterium]